jgi:hypothetical protein
MATNDHTNDITAVEHPDAPGDYGEIFDYVLRKGPISHDGICNDIHSMAPDAIHDALTWCEENDHIESVEGDIHEHGTTRRVYYVPEPDD